LSGGSEGVDNSLLKDDHGVVTEEELEEELGVRRTAKVKHDGQRSYK
jgi:hypothetical protein